MNTLPLADSKTLDKQVLVGIYEQYSPALYRYAFRQLGDQDVAEECVSETFSRFLQAVRYGRGPDKNVRAYLYRVAHNWISDYYRRQPPPTISLEMNEHPDMQSSPDRIVSEQMERERVRAALMSLPSDQRRVIVLRHLEQWSHKDVAEALDKSVEATRALQYRALAALRRLLLEKKEDTHD